jgi:hypothetical protein
MKKVKLEIVKVPEVVVVGVAKFFRCRYCPDKHFRTYQAKRNHNRKEHKNHGMAKQLLLDLARGVVDMVVSRENKSVVAELLKELVDSVAKGCLAPPLPSLLIPAPLPLLLPPGPRPCLPWRFCYSCGAGPFGKKSLKGHLKGCEVAQARPVAKLKLFSTAVDVAESKKALPAASALTSPRPCKLPQLATGGPEVVILREVPALPEAQTCRGGSGLKGGPAVDVAESEGKKALPAASALTSPRPSEPPQLATGGPEVVILREVPVQAAQGGQRRGWCQLCGNPSYTVYERDHPACLYQLHALGYPAYMGRWWGGS